MNCLYRPFEYSSLFERLGLTFLEVDITEGHARKRLDFTLFEVGHAV